MKTVNQRKKLVLFTCIILMFGISTATERWRKTAWMGFEDTIAVESQVVWPISNSQMNSDYPFSSTYGPRLQASQDFQYDFHRGIDIPTPKGTNIHAIQTGEVVASGYDNGDLRIVLKIQHTPLAEQIQGKKYYYAVYRHLQSVANDIMVGNVYPQGKILGTTGSTGTGTKQFAHLHFDIAIGNYNQVSNTHPLQYLISPNLGVPDIQKINPASNFFNPSAKSVSFRTVVDANELDMTQVYVIGKINQFSVEGIFNLENMNNVVNNPKTDLDNFEQILPNNVKVSVYPAAFNANNSECEIDWVFDFSSAYVGPLIITSWEFEIKASDIFGGWSKVFISYNLQINAFAIGN